MLAFDPCDRALLAEVQASLIGRPFAAKVRVAGTLVPRALARQIERNLLRLKSAIDPFCPGAGETPGHGEGGNLAAVETATRADKALGLHVHEGVDAHA